MQGWPSPYSPLSTRLSKAARKRNMCSTPCVHTYALMLSSSVIICTRARNMSFSLSDMHRARNPLSLGKRERVCLGLNSLALYWRKLCLFHAKWTAKWLTVPFVMLALAEKCKCLTYSCWDQRIQPKVGYACSSLSTRGKEEKPIVHFDSD